MVFYINLWHIKIQLSFTLTNFKLSGLITKENILFNAKKTIESGDPYQWQVEQRGRVDEILIPEVSLIIVGKHSPHVAS